MRRLLLVLVVLSIGSPGCAWVKLSQPGGSVEVVANTEVLGCDRVGNTKAQVLPKVLGIPRRQAIVQRELNTLARNEGAKLGGNTVTPMPARAPGEREYAVYRCDD